MLRIQPDSRVSYSRTSVATHDIDEFAFDVEDDCEPVIELAEMDRPFHAVAKAEHELQWKSLGNDLFELRVPTQPMRGRQPARTGDAVTIPFHAQKRSLQSF